MQTKEILNSEKLKNVMAESHGFYIGEDILSSPAFFPDKRAPLLVVFNSSENFRQILNKLLDCYGEKTQVRVFWGSDEKTLSLGELYEKMPFPAVVLFPAQKLTERARFDFSDLVEIMTTLRGENGCKWDRAQTHKSIRINLIEEAYELVDAIDADDKAMILEEIGDVLLQAVFHTHIEMQEGTFGYGEMLTAICQKLLSRHTHIFGENRAENAEQALNFWNEAKSVEKGYKTVASAMELVPKNMPALLYSYKLQKKAAKAGFDWDDVKGVVDKIGEEILELMSARNTKEREDEGGDLLFAAVNLLRFLDVEPELALKAASEKFLKRFKLLEQKISAQGKKIGDLSLAQMEEVWQDVKRAEDSGNK
jgi:tetrapyrrole methylase family protein/MazG family protein